MLVTNRKFTALWGMGSCKRASARALGYAIRPRVREAKRPVYRAFGHIF